MWNENVVNTIAYTEWSQLQQTVQKNNEKKCTKITPTISGKRDEDEDAGDDGLV